MKKITKYAEKGKHTKGDVQMLNHIFPKATFLDLKNNQGVMIGKTPRQIVKHLWDTFCKEEEKEAEVLVQENKLVESKYNPDEQPQAYFKDLEDVRTMIVFLDEVITEKRLVFHAGD